MPALRPVPCGVSVVLSMNGLVLMGKRKGSHGSGTWAFPGGWMEHGEDFQTTAEREVLEETSIRLTGPVSVLTALSTVFKDRDVHSVTIMLLAQQWTGSPKVLEPEKLEGEWQWFSPDALPKPLFEPAQLGMETYLSRMTRS